MNSGKFFRTALFPLVIIAAIAWLALQSIGGSDKSDVKVTFSQALNTVRQQPQAIQSVMFRPSSQEVELHYADGKTAKVAYPVDESAFELQQLLEDKQIIFDAKRTGSSAWWNILTSLLPFVLLFGFWIFLMQGVRSRQGSDPTSSLTGR
jgi:ATP-dependent Zn protease